jgi:hypothetical protein
LRKTFGLKSDEVTGETYISINFINLNSLPSIIRTTKSERVRWAEYVARLGRIGMHVGYWWESQNEKTTRRTEM